MTKIGSNLTKIIYFLPLCVLASFVTFFSVGTIAGHSFVADCHRADSPYRFYDFCVYYCGGKIAGSADHASLYDAAVQQRYLMDMRGAAPMTKDTLVMQLAPFYPCLLIPLAMMPGDTAFTYYFIGSAAAYFGGCFLLAKVRWPEPRPYKTFFLAFALLGTVPCFITATLGQLSHYLFFLVCAYIYFLHKQKDKTAGIFLALSSFKPHYALFWAIPALAQKRWQVIYAALVMELILLAMAIAVLGLQTVLGYPAAIIKGDNLGSWSQIAILMISLRGLLFTIFHSPLVFPLTFVVMLLALAASFFMWRRHQAEGAVTNNEQTDIAPSDPAPPDKEQLAELPGSNLQSFRWLCASSVILCLFCSVHAYIYDAVLLIIPAILCVDWARSPGGVPPTKSERFIQLLLLATPYVQWLGLALLPINYHRSVPTALLLLALSTAFLLSLWPKQAPAN